jgi:hypothetical protein
MISVEDCIAMCDLTREEIDAIAEHEHLSEVGAAALADYLMHAANGPAKVRQMIVDDIREAMEHKNRDHARELLMALKQFEKEHPESAPKVA